MENRKNKQNQDLFFVFFFKINYINKPVAHQEEREESNKIRNERGETKTDTRNQRNTKNHEYYANKYANKFDSLEEINKFLETYNLQKLNQEKRQLEPTYH